MLVSATPSLRAQTVPSGPAEDRILPPQRPEDTRRPSFRIERPAPQEAASTALVNVTAFRIEGATVVDRAQIDAAVAPFLGQQVPIQNVFRAADAVTSLYADAGYALSFALVPVQDVADGTVTLRIVEGTVDKVDVQLRNVSAHVRDASLKAFVATRFRPLINAGPVRAEALEFAALSVREMGGTDVSVVVKPSEDTEGAASLLVIVDVDGFDASLTTDNRLREEFGDYRVTARAAVNSLVVPGDRLSLLVSGTPDSKGIQSGQLRYQAMIPSTATTLHATGFTARTRGQNGLLGLLEFRGRETSVRAGFEHPLTLTRAFSLRAGTELTGSSTRSSIFGVDLIAEDVRTLSYWLAGDVAPASGGAVNWRALVDLGLTGLGASPALNPTRSRTTGQPDFAAVIVEGGIESPPLPGGFKLRADIEGQLGLGGGALASRECSFGGDRFGRAFDPGAFGGEHCVKVAMEVSRPVAIGKLALAPFAFVDTGKAWQVGPLDVLETRTSKTTSFGFGSRIALSQYLVGQVEVSWPGNGGRFAPNGSDNPRIFFTLGARL